MNKDLAPSDRFELFAETREALVAELVRDLGTAVRDIAGDLEQAAQRWGVARDRQALLTAARSLRDGARGWLDTIGRTFADRALRCLEVSSQGVDGGAEDADADDRRWRQLDETELDAQILVGDLARMVQESVGAGYPAYVGRIEWMTQHHWPTDVGVPLGACTCAHAVTMALRAAVLDAVPRSVLRTAMLKRLPRALASVLQRTDDRLREQGVPTLRAVAPAPAVPSPLPAAVDLSDAASPPLIVDPIAAAVTPSSTDQPPASGRGLDTSGAGGSAAQAALLATVADVRALDSSPLAAALPPGQLRVTPTLQPVIEIEKDAVAFAHSTDTVPYSREARHALFRNIRDRMRQAGATPAQLSVVDIVSAMFDYVVDDRRLPEASKPLVWRLHQPVIVLSLLDPGYLGDEPRSLRKLIEHFGAISTAFADEMGKGSELHRRLETVVRAVEIVASALQTRSAVMARQVEHEYLRASRSVTQLVERVVNERQSLEAAPGRRNRRDYRRRPNREREREVGERLRDRLNERIAHYQVPDSVKDFLLNVWLRHLRTAALRDGEDSTEFKVAMEVVDNLLWSLDSDKGRRYSRRELAERIPPLTRLLASGLREIGARDDEYKPFFDELFLVHLRKMQPRSSQSAEFLAHPLRGTVPGTDVPVLDDPVRVDTRADEPAGPTVGADPDTAASGQRGLPTAAVRHEPDAARPAAVAPPASGAMAAEPPGSATGQGGAVSDSTPAPDHKVTVPSIPAMPTPGGITEPLTARRATSTPAPAAAALESSAEGGEPIVVTAPVAVPVRRSVDGEESDRAAQKLREVLSSLDLADLPAPPTTRPMPVEEALTRVSRGDWLKFTTSASGGQSFAKVAWINQRRTIVLLVRHPDRKAVSIGMRELRVRFEQGKVHLVAQHPAASQQPAG